MGALSTAISGLQASQRWLDVIANNVSNNNTVAYKSGRVTFSDLVNQGLSSASGPNAGSGLGGINPQQLGMGVRVSTIQTMMTNGAAQVTGVATDVAIQGSGFITVNSGDSTFFTRAGNLTFDSAGNLVTSSGGQVQGWQVEFKTTIDPLDSRIQTVIGNVLDTTNTSDIRSIKIPQDMIIAPKGTSAVQLPSIKDQGVIMKGNLDERTPPNLAADLAFKTAGFLAAGTGIGFANASMVISAAPVDLMNVAGFLIDPFTGLIPDHTITQTVYDSVGDPRSITYQFYQVGDTQGAPPQPPQWAWFAFDTTVVTGSAVFTGATNKTTCIGGTGIDVWVTVLNGEPNSPPVASLPCAYQLISFNADGSLQTNGGYDITAAGGQQFNPILGITNRVNPWNSTVTPSGVLPSGGLSAMEFSTNFGTPNTYAAGSFTDVFGGFAPNVVMPGGMGMRDGLTGDYGSGTVDPVSGIYLPNHTATAIFQDGYPDGSLTNISIDQTGTISGQFTNGQIIALAQFAMASFSNPAGLAKVGDNYFSTTANSGQVRYDTAGSNGFGTIQGGALEGSNVDLTIELTNMIVAQRMFESNARVITAQDSVMNTLVQLGR